MKIVTLPRLPERPWRRWPAIARCRGWLGAVRAFRMPTRSPARRGVFAPAASVRTARSASTRTARSPSDATATSMPIVAAPAASGATASASAPERSLIHQPDRRVRTSCGAAKGDRDDRQEIDKTMRRLASLRRAARARVGFATVPATRAGHDGAPAQTQSQTPEPAAFRRRRSSSSWRRSRSIPIRF